MICPVGPGVATKHDTARYWGYTAIYNLLDYPACTFPTGEYVSEAEHPKDETYKPRDNEFDAENWARYNPKDYEGAPICLQLVGRKWDDEGVISAVTTISNALGLKDGGSYQTG